MNTHRGGRKKIADIAVIARDRRNLKTRFLAPLPMTKSRS
jgi:hypothetical protein